MHSEAPVNPALLVWARSESGFDLPRVAKKVGVKPERLIDWEAGLRRPTIRQAQSLARVYRRPLGTLFLPAPPTIQPLATEFRRLRGVAPGTESPELRFALREMSSRREVALELMEELGDSPIRPAIALSAARDPQAAAASLRDALGLEFGRQRSFHDAWAAWRGWREAVETTGIAVYQFSGVGLEEVRGVSILALPLPAIGVSSRETIPEAKTYTLLHELVHVALAVAEEEAPAALDRHDERAWRDLEQFAERVAGELLVPADELSRELDASGGAPREWTIEFVRRLARRFWATPLALATRLRQEDLMTSGEYEGWLGLWNAAVASNPRRGGGFVPPERQALGRAGRPFVRLVLEALDTSRITAVQACHHLGLRYDHFGKLRGALVGRSSGGAGTTGEE